MLLQNLKPVIYLFFIYNILEIILLFITPISTKGKNFLSDLVVIILFFVSALITTKERSVYVVITLMSLLIFAKTIGYAVYEKENILKSRSRFTFFISGLLALVLFILLIL